MFEPRKVGKETAERGASKDDFRKLDLLPNGRATQKGDLTLYEEAAGTIFLRGMEPEEFDYQFEARPGVIKERAERHLGAILGAIDLGESQKINIAAKLLREWFILRSEKLFMGYPTSRRKKTSKRAQRRSKKWE